MITSSQITVGTVATLIHDATQWSRVHLHNLDNTKTMYLGGAAVTTSTGLALLKEDSLDLHMSPGEILYGVTSSGTHNVAIMVQAP